MPPLVTTTVATIEDLVRAARAQTLYAVLDACDEPRVPRKVRELGSCATTLYAGSRQDELWAIAPYLVQVDEALIAWLVDNLWHDPWGIFAISDAGLGALRSHFRKFVIMTRDDGTSWYFRFYDPRVLAATLPAYDAPQVADFFGPTSALGWVDAATGTVTFARAWHFGDDATAVPRITLRGRN